MKNIPCDESKTKKGRQKRKTPLSDSKTLRLVLDVINNGVCVTDPEGYILYFNKPYGDFLGMVPEEQIGKHCTEVIENTRLHIVAKTGKPEINIPQRIQGHEMVVQRIPIKRDGKVIAVYGQVIFKDVRDVQRLAKKVAIMESKVRLYEEELIALRSTRYTLANIVGLSDSILSLQNEALSAAATNLPVLITGESGTGKELFAQGIHHASQRRLYPFIRINCSAIPRELFESELFGYEKGAFTGAKYSGKPGKFELAHRGTLFLDEIGDLPLEMQPKLLRVLEEKEFERVGGTKIIKTDFRLIASTNQNLEKMMGEGRFRKDLFYRLNVLPLNIPALRERREDIIPLARHIITQIAQEPFLLEAEIDKPAEAALVRYDWPGNVRELANVMERVLAALEGKTIHLCDLPFYLYESRKEPSQSRGALLKRTQESAEKEAIRYTLESTSYNKAQAADLLGIHRTVLYRKMKRFGLPLHPD